MTIDNALESAHYGRMCRVAINFYIQTGNPAELDAAVCYARGAAYFAHRAIARAIEPDATAVCHETVAGHTTRLPFAINVF